MSAIDDLVLKLTTYLPGGMDWKPDLHPREHDGKFKKKFGGVFNALNGLKSGKFGGNVVYKGSEGYHAGKDASVPQVAPGHKLGGVEIHAPTEHGYAPSVHHIDWNLAPGEKVYPVTGGPNFAPEKGQNGVVVHHNDGSATVLMPSAEGEMPKVGATSTHFTDLAKNLTAIGYNVDTEHPIDSNDELEAQKVQQEMAEVEHAKNIGAAPESAYGKSEQEDSINGGKSYDTNGDASQTPPQGEESTAKPTYQEGHVGPGGNKIVHMLQDEQGNHLGHVEQLDNGKYTSHNAKGEKVGNITKHLPTAIEKAKSGKLTTPSTYQHKKPLKKAAAEAAKAEPKAEISPEKTVEEPKPEPKKYDVKVDGQHVGHIESHGDAKFTSHDAEGNHLGNHVGPMAAAEKVKANHAEKVKAAEAEQKAKDEAAAKEKAEKEAAAAKEKADAEAAAAKAKEAAKPSEPAHLEGKNVFQHVHAEDGTHLGHIEKTPEGKYTSHDAAGNKVGNITKHLPTAIEKVKSGKLTTPEKKTDDVTPVKAEAKKISDSEHHVIGEGGQFLGKIVKDDTTGKWQSHDHQGNKLGYTISNTQTAIDKVKVAAAKNGIADEPAEPVAEEPKVEEAKPELKKFDIHTLGDGELAGYAHEQADGTWKATDAEGNDLGVHASLTKAKIKIKGNHYNKKAEVQKAQELDDLKKANDEIAQHVEAHEADTVVGKVSLLPGQAAYVTKSSVQGDSTYSPWAAIVQDGKVSHIYNPTTGETKDHTAETPWGGNYIDGWQSSLDGGELIKQAENGPENTPSTETAKKSVAEASVPEPDGFTHANFGAHGEHHVELKPGEQLWVNPDHPEYGAWVAKPGGLSDGYSGEGAKIVPDSQLAVSTLEKSGWQVVGKGPEISEPVSNPDAGPLAAVYKNTMTGHEYQIDANGIITEHTASGTTNVHNAGMSASIKTTLEEIVAEHPDGNWKKVELDVPETHEPPAGATPEPVKKAVAKKKAATKDSDLPHEYEFGGKVHKMKPGDSIWTKEIDGDTKVYYISGVSGKGTVYNGDASTNYWLGDDSKKVSLAKLKKEGWTKEAIGEPKQEISGPDAEVDLSLIPKDWQDAPSVYSYADQLSYKLTGYQSALYKTDNFGDEQVGKDVAQYLANLNYIKANPDEFNLDKSDKIKVTKAINYATALWNAHSVAVKVNEPDYVANEQDKVTLSESNAVFSKSHHNTPQYAITALVQKIKVAEFQAGLKNLGFDLQHGSHDEFVNYAKNNDAPFLGGMDENMVKDWTNYHLGTPGYSALSGLSKEAIENKASQQLKMKAVAANAQSVAEKKAALEPSATEKLIQQATTKQYESLYKKVSKLKGSYYHTGDEDGVWDATFGGGNYAVYGPVHDPEIVTSANFTPEEFVSFLEDHPEWKPAPDTWDLGNGAQQKSNQLLDEEGWFPENLITTPQWGPGALGALGGDAMTTQQRDQWLISFLTGDKIGQYQIEKKALISAGYDHETALAAHHGNPDHPAGKVAYQALANHLNTLPYWTNKSDVMDLNEWSAEDLKSFANEFGLTDAYQAKDNPELSDKFKLVNWLNSHQNLPAPQNAPSVPENATLKTSTGVEFDVPKGASVVFNKNADMHTIITDEDYYSVYADGLETVHSKYGQDFFSEANKEAALAAHLAMGNEDVTPHWGPAGAPKLAKVAEKPEGVTDTTWDFVTGAEAGGKELADFLGELSKASDSEIATALNSTYGNHYDAAERIKLLSAPPSIQKLAAWTNQEYHDATHSEVATAIKAKLAAGEYSSPDIETWTHPTSSKPMEIPPGATVYKVTDGYGNPFHAVMLDETNGYKIDSGGNVAKLMNSDKNYLKQNGAEVFTSKANLSHEKASSEGQTFTEQAFKKLADAEDQEVWKGSHSEPVSAFKFNQAVKKMDGGDKYQALTKYLHTLPVGVKQLATESALKHDTDTLDALMWKWEKGAYALSPEVHTNPVLPADSKFAAKVAEGKITGNDINAHWSTQEMDEYLSEFNLPIDQWAYAETKAAQIAEHLKTLIPPTVTTEEKISKGMVDYHNLDLVPTDKTYGGMHTKHGWTDQFGQEWMSKGFNSDPFGAFRVDVEHEANLIGKMFGFNSATTFTKEVGGKYSVIQKIADNIGDLQGFQPKDLNDKQLIGAMQEHILDWLVANHDSHEENILRLPDGESMLGIDKGQAFKHLGKDQLAVGYKPPENGAPVWYDRFYHDLMNGKIDQERADKITQAVLAKAYGVQSRNDALYREHLEKAFAQRPAGSWPSHLNTEEKFLDYAMARKANLLNDFADLYKGLYEKAGYDWNIDTEAFGKNVGGAHIANSALYANEVAEANAYGKALLFNSEQLEDAHIMHNTMHQMNGGTALLGFGKVRGEADKALTAWLSNRVEGKLAHGQNAYVPQVAQPGAVLPYVDQLHNATVDYAKTVGKHATIGGKEPDGAYNEGYVSSAANTAKTLKAHIDAAKEFRAQNPDALYSGSGVDLTTLEQQDAWISAAEQKLQEYNLVKQAHEANTPVKNMFPDSVPFASISYKPSPGLTHHDESKPVEKYVLDSGEHAVKTSDGGHYLLDKDGGKTWVSSQDYGNHVSGGTQVPIEKSGASAPTWTNGDMQFVKKDNGKWHMDGASSDFDETALTKFLSTFPEGSWKYEAPDAEEEKSQTVQIAGKVFKVTHRKAALHGGIIDPATGKLVEKSKQSQALQQGHEYTIEYGDVKIHYRPWTEPGVAKSQQGVLHYEVRNWDGGHAAIDDVLDTLRIAGLDLNPADAESLEHFYWNHLTNVIQDRADWSDKKHKALVDEVKQAKLASPNMSTGESLGVLKKAWANAYGQSVVDNAQWQPRFGEHHGQDNVGRPHWLRPDIGVEGLKKIYGYDLPIHHIQSNGVSDAADRTHSILTGGGLMATEERPRVLGSSVEGMSSTSDQHHGSSGYVFTRQNQSKHASGSDGGPMIVVDPTTALRTSTYAFDSDNYGEIDNRKTGAHFNPKQMYGHSGSGNEMMVKHDAPVYAVIFGSSAAAQSEIKRLHGEGVFEINGRKVEDIVLSQDVWNNSYQERIDNLWKDLLEAEKKYTEGGA